MIKTKVVKKLGSHHVPLLRVSGLDQTRLIDEKNLIDRNSDNFLTEENFLITLDTFGGSSDLLESPNVRFTNKVGFNTTSKPLPFIHRPSLLKHGVNTEVEVTLNGNHIIEYENIGGGFRRFVIYHDQEEPGNTIRFRLSNGQVFTEALKVEPVFQDIVEPTEVWNQNYENEFFFTRSNDKFKLNTAPNTKGIPILKVNSSIDLTLLLTKNSLTVEEDPSISINFSGLTVGELAESLNSIDGIEITPLIDVSLDNNLIGNKRIEILEGESSLLFESSYLVAKYRSSSKIDYLGVEQVGESWYPKVSKGEIRKEKKVTASQLNELQSLSGNISKDLILSYGIPREVAQNALIRKKVKGINKGKGILGVEGVLKRSQEVSILIDGRKEISNIKSRSEKTILLGSPLESDRIEIEGVFEETDLTFRGFRHPLTQIWQEFDLGFSRRKIISEDLEKDHVILFLQPTIEIKFLDGTQQRIDNKSPIRFVKVEGRKVEKTINEIEKGNLKEQRYDLLKGLSNIPGIPISVVRVNGVSTLNDISFEDISTGGGGVSRDDLNKPPKEVGWRAYHLTDMTTFAGMPLPKNNNLVVAGLEEERLKRAEEGIREYSYPGTMTHKKDKI